MRASNKLAWILTGSLSVGSVLYAQTIKSSESESKPVYENNFEKAALDSVPEDMLVLDGAFAVKEEGGNKFLQLPGAPLDTYGVLFGPTEKDGITVSGRIYGTMKGRRSPAFGIGLNGAGGFRLQVSAAKNAVELFKGDMSKTNAPFAWQAGKWTEFRLTVEKTIEGKWAVIGKVWVSGSPEPKTASIALIETEEPPPGRASIWGNPFSGTPIRFDNLRVNATSAKR